MRKSPFGFTLALLGFRSGFGVGHVDVDPVEPAATNGTRKEGLVEGRVLPPGLREKAVVRCFDGGGLPTRNLIPVGAESDEMKLLTNSKADGIRYILSGLEHHQEHVAGGRAGQGIKFFLQKENMWWIILFLLSTILFVCHDFDSARCVAIPFRSSSGEML